MSRTIETPIDLSVIATFHNEDYLIGATIGSLVEAVEKARAMGIVTEVYLALDDPSALTRRLVLSHADEYGYRVVEMSHADQGLVRNACVEHVAGEYVAFLDGDDLFGYDWLWRGWQLASQTDEPLIVHPEVNLYFEGHYSIFVQRASTDPYFDADFLRVCNYWDAMCLTRRSVLLDFPYRQRDVELGFAYEDWEWNMRTLGAGIGHEIAQDTIHFKRRRKQSQSKVSRDRGAIYYPNKLSYYDEYQ